MKQASYVLKRILAFLLDGYWSCGSVFSHFINMMTFDIFKQLNHDLENYEEFTHVRDSIFYNFPVHAESNEHFPQKHIFHAVANVSTNICNVAQTDRNIK